MALHLRKFAFFRLNLLLHMFQLSFDALSGFGILQGLIGCKAKEICTILRLHLPLRKPFGKISGLFTQRTQPLSTVIEGAPSRLE